MAKAPANPSPTGGTKGGRASGSKPGGNRRDKLASFEEARKKEARNRTIRLLIICVVAASLILSVPIYLYWQDAQARGAALADLGVPASAAGCDTAIEDPATGNQEHVAAGTQIEYAQYPPDSGKHYDTPASFLKKFYTESDRPEVGTLVHNLEHGYTIVWYRPSAPAEQIDALEAIAKTFSSDDYDPTKKFIAAPWLDTDPPGIPEGKDVVLTRWTADPNNPSVAANQRGVRQACTAVSGPAIADFMTTYPWENSPEANAA